MIDLQFSVGRRVFLRGGAALAVSGVLRRLVGPPASAAAAAPKRIYLAPDDHTDYFWSAGEAEYRDAFLEVLDYYLDRADATESDPGDYHSRWHCDGSLWIWTYEQNRTPAQFERLMARVRDGHISFPLNPLVLCSGAMPAEAVLRGMQYAGRLERRYGVRILMAEEVENQTLPYGLGALWAGAGARYAWKGICGCDTQVPSPGDREHEVYWWEGADGSRILVKWNSMLVNNQGMGGYAEAWDPSAIVEYVDKDAAFLSRYPYRVVGAFGQGWDNVQTTTQDCVAAAKSASNAGRRVVVSDMVDFFQDLEATHGAELPVQSCSFGNEWDLYCAALAEVSARVKRAVERLRGAESLATWASLGDPAFESTIDRAARDRAWMDLGLFWEHDLGMAGRFGAVVEERVAWQRRLATEIASYVDGLQAAALTRLGALIRKTGNGRQFYVYNPLSWARTDYVDIDVADAGPAHVVDVTTGGEVPSQRMTRGGATWLRVLAQDVPAMGYRVYAVRPGAGAVFPPAATVAGGVLENDLYRLVLAGRGAITSLVDKARGGREVVQEVGGRLANDLGPGIGSVVVENVGPVSVTLRAEAAEPVAHTTRVTLYRAIDRIDIANEITQNFSDVQTWAFGLAVDPPTVWHEEVGAMIRACLVGDGGHYSPRNARYDWLTLNHLADMSDATAGVTLSNADCFFMRLGESTVTSLDTATPQIAVLAGGRVVNGANGIPDQGGDAHFLQRFALRAHGAYDPVEAMRLALEHQNPLLAAPLAGGDVYPAGTHGFVDVSDPGVFVWALKPADDGIAEGGIVVRLWNVSRQPARVTLSLPWPITAVQEITHVETPVSERTVADGSLTGTLAVQQIKSYALFCGEPDTTPAAPTATGTPAATVRPPSATPTSTPTGPAPSATPTRKSPLHIPMCRRR